MVLIGYPDRHVSHSCDPNAWEFYGGASSYLVARRDIAAGDFFLLPVEWQREYRPLLAEWFVRRHRERVSELDGGCGTLADG